MIDLRIQASAVLGHARLDQGIELGLHLGRLLGRLDVVRPLALQACCVGLAISHRRPTLFCTRYCTIQLGVKSWVAAGMSSLLTTLPMTCVLLLADVELVQPADDLDLLPVFLGDLARPAWR